MPPSNEEFYCKLVQNFTPKVLYICLLNKSESMHDIYYIFMCIKSLGLPNQLHKYTRETLSVEQ